MSFLIFFGIVVAALLLALVLSLRAGPSATAAAIADEPAGTSPRNHVTYLPQIRQALSRADLAYLASHASPAVLDRTRADRRRVALDYLKEVSSDFERLQSLARVIAGLSPEVSASTEWERLRLAMRFRLRVRYIRFRLQAGSFPLEQVTLLNNIVSGLSVRIEMAMVQLGERAALAAELASSVNRNGVDLS